MFGRFTAPELLQLGRPPALAAKTFETLRSDSIAEMLRRFSSVGIAFNVAAIESEPAIIEIEVAAYRDMLRRQQIDDAVAQTYLGLASGAYLDQRAADYGVLRRVVTIADPTLGTADVYEDDDSTRYRARLSWEALSVAGPAGAYVFHALDAHQGVFDGRAYGPESGYVEPGEVLVVVQARGETGIPTAGMVDAVAARLDAYEVVYPDNSSVIRSARDEQSVRPLGARVTVAAARGKTFNVTATLYVDANGDREAIRLAALANLAAYLESRKRVGVEVPQSGIIAALHLTTPGGIPVVDEVNVVGSDVVPSHLEIAVPGTITLTMVPR